MKTGLLLERLLAVAQTAKTDFAISMNMTPSGLSRILTGKRLPPAQEKRVFARQAAAYLSGALYARYCHLKLGEVFPVIYEFRSRLELEQFLCAAVEYALELDLTVEENDSPDYPDREVCHMGLKEVLNRFCLIVSDHIMSGGSPMEFFSGLPFFDPLYADMFRRVQLLLPKHLSGIRFHHFIDMPSIEGACGAQVFAVLDLLEKAHARFDFALWQAARPIAQPFLLLKGRFLMLFCVQMDGTLTMTLVRHKSYLALFFTAVTRLEAKKISRNRGEAIAYLEHNLGSVDRLVDRGIVAAFNFVSIGYLLNRGEIERAPGADAVKRAALSLLPAILKESAAFYVTVNAMMDFCATGKAVVPLMGAIDFAPDRRVAYLERLQPLIGGEGGGADKIRVIKTELPKMAILCAKGLCLVYLADDAYANEKLYCLETDALACALRDALAQNAAAMLDFSPELLHHYLDEMASTIHM